MLGNCSIRKTAALHLRGGLCILGMVLWGAGATAQSAQGGFDVGSIQSQILVIEFERAFSQSAYGKRFALDLEEAGAEIAAENRQIEAELEKEELQLTEQRKAMLPDDFRKLADAFDQKVQQLRREQDTKAQSLRQWQDQARREFLGAARPVLNQIMQRSGAVVILEKRETFVSVSEIDITDQLIAGINSAIGDGTPDSKAPSDPTDP